MVTSVLVIAVIALFVSGVSGLQLSGNLVRAAPGPLTVYGWVTDTGGSPVGDAVVNITILNTDGSVRVYRQGVTDDRGLYVANSDFPASIYSAGDRVEAVAVYGTGYGSNYAILTQSQFDCGILLVSITYPLKWAKLTPHSPICIDGNENFTAANGVTGGSGLAGDPFIIGGWDIDANRGEYGVCVRGSDRYFAIVNCSVRGAANSGIWLRDTANGRLSNNTCQSNWNPSSPSAGVGIVLSSSNHVVVEDNYCADNSFGGIYLSQSSNNSIFRNTCVYNTQFDGDNWGDGIDVEYGESNLIVGNYCSYNDWDGIWLFNSRCNTVSNNTCSANKCGDGLVWGAGIELSDSEHNLIADNFCTNNSYDGIRVRSSEITLLADNDITRNLLLKNCALGIRIVSCSGNTLHMNALLRNNGANGTYDPLRPQAQDTGQNSWDVEGRGNYWCDYDGVDANNDGTGDSPYVIDSDTEDNYPQMVIDNRWETPPTASFFCTYSAIDSLSVRFDCSWSNDSEDPPEVLEARWDFDGDHSWDIGWGKEKVAYWQYCLTGNYTVRLEIRDSAGAIGSMNQSITLTCDTPITRTMFLRPDADHGGATNVERYPAPGKNPVWSSNISAETFFNTDGGGTGRGTSYISRPNSVFERLIYYRFDLTSAGLPATGATICEVDFKYRLKYYNVGGYSSIHESAPFLGEWYSYSSRPIVEEELAYTSIPETGAVWKNITATSGGLLDRIQANYDGDGHMYFAITDERINGSVVSYEVGGVTPGILMNAYLQVRYYMTTWDSHYFTRVNEVASGGDGDETYVYCIGEANTSSSLLFNFSNPDWSRYPDILDIDVTPWALTIPESGGATSNRSCYYETNPLTDREWTASEIDSLYTEHGHQDLEPYEYQDCLWICETRQVSWSGEYSDGGRWTQVAIKVNVTYLPGDESAFRYDLVPGWNLVSIPLLVNNCTASALGLATGDVVAGYDSATGTYNRSFTVGISPSFKDFRIIHSDGYWIYAVSIETLVVHGTEPSGIQTRSILVPSTGGWAVFGIASLSTGFSASDIPSWYAGGSVLVVASYDPVTMRYMTWTPGAPPFKDFSLVSGEAYWMWCTSSGVLSYGP